jgi:hypothetical protein
MRKTIAATIAALALAVPAAAVAAPPARVPTPVPVLDVTPGPGCMSHNGYTPNEAVHMDWGSKFRFSSEHGHNTPEGYEPALSSSDFKAACGN